MNWSTVAVAQAVVCFFFFYPSLPQSTLWERWHLIIIKTSIIDHLSSGAVILVPSKPPQRRGKKLANQPFSYTNHDIAVRWLNGCLPLIASLAPPLAIDHEQNDNLFVKVNCDRTKDRKTGTAGKRGRRKRVKKNNKLPTAMGRVSPIRIDL